MDTSILHEKIKYYEGKANNALQKEIISYFKNWLYSVENYISELEMENFKYGQNEQKQYELIEMLVKILIITGNSDKMVIDFQDENIKAAIDFLLANKDRNNHKNIYSISILLELAKREGVKINDLKQLKRYA